MLDAKINPKGIGVSYMRKIINVRSIFLTYEERINAARYNSRVFTPEELLDNYLICHTWGNSAVTREIVSIYRNAILNRMKDAEILYSILDNDNA